MALICCPECGQEVSDSSSSCLHCGYDLTDLSVEDKDRSLRRKYGIGEGIIGDTVQDCADYSKRLIAYLDEYMGLFPDSFEAYFRKAITFAYQYIPNEPDTYSSIDNTMLPTFAFELDSIQKTGGAPVTGWFVRDDLVTQYYMLIWPNTKCKNINGEWRRTPLGEIEFSDFTIIEAMLIRKDDIFDFLQRNNLAKSHLLEYAKRLRATHGKKNEKIDVQLENRLSITFSGQIPEKPINLIIRREKLKEIAKQVYLISQDGFARIK